jgi:hypothetical protein
LKYDSCHAELEIQIHSPRLIIMFEHAFRNIDDVLRKEAGCTTELDYTEQSSWLLFLKYLAGLEEDKAIAESFDGEMEIHN